MPYDLTPASDKVSAEVLKGINERRELYRERDDIMHDIRRHRLMRQKPSLHRNWLKRLGTKSGPKVPLMLRLLQTAVTAVNKDFPKVSSEPLSLKDKGNADEESQALNYLLQTIDRQHKRNFIAAFLFSHFGDGLSVFKTVEGPWAGFPVQEEGESNSDYNDRVEDFKDAHPMPFYVSRVNGLTFYPPLDEYSEGPCIEIGWRSIRETFSQVRSLMANEDEEKMQQIPEGMSFPWREFPPSLPPNQEVAEIWYDDYCFIATPGIKGSPVLYIENPMGEKPYSYGYADPTGVDDPANIGMSICYPLYYITPHIDSMLGYMMAWATFMMPTLYTTQTPSPYVRATQETASWNWEPGYGYDLPTGRVMGVVQPPDMGAPANQIMSMLLGIADRGGLPPTISGDITGSRLAALTYQEAYGAGLARLAPGVRGAEFVLGDMLAKCRRRVADYGEDLALNGWDWDTGELPTRGWAKLRAAEAAKNRPIKVEMQPDSFQNEIAKGTHADFMSTPRPGRPPLWSHRRASLFSGVRPEEYEDMMDEIAADAALSTMIQLMAQKAAAEDPELGPYMAAQTGSPLPEGEGTGIGRNGSRPGIAAGQGGGRRGGNATQKPRGNRGTPVGRT